MQLEKGAIKLEQGDCVLMLGASLALWAASAFTMPILSAVAALGVAVSSIGMLLIFVSKSSKK